MPAAPLSSSTKPQYALSYAVLGSVVPFISIFLADRGLSKTEIGYVIGLSSLGIVLTPIIVTLLADTAFAGRLLMAFLFALAGLFAAMLIPWKGFWPVLIIYSLHSFSLQAIFPLQDGIHFAAQSVRKSRGLSEVPYQAARMWGSVGYIVPMLLLWFILHQGGPMTATLYVAAGCSIAGTLYALFLLPRTPPPSRAESHSRLPTAAAARAICEPHVLIFCIAMFLVHFAAAAYYYGYPLHLVDRSGLKKEWVGPVTAIGTTLELAYILGFGWLCKRFTLRRLMYAGTFITAVRLFILAQYPGLWIAMASQGIHGLTVIVIHIAPPIFLNNHATDRYRNSIQGLYTMAFAGAGRVLGSFLTGYLAEKSLALAFNVSGVICLVGTGMFFFAFREKHAAPSKDPHAQTPNPQPAGDPIL